MPAYSVDTAAVADTAARTRTRIATIQTEVDGMRGDIGLLQSCWTGTASDSMAACAADWHLTQLQVQSNLDQISLALDNAAVCVPVRAGDGAVGPVWSARVAHTLKREAAQS